MNVKTFIEEIKLCRDFYPVVVRGRALAISLKCRELRTKKNTHRAAAFDILGNVTVLTSSGYVLQLIGNEYKGR